MDSAFEEPRALIPELLAHLSQTEDKELLKRLKEVIEVTDSLRQRTQQRCQGHKQGFITIYNRIDLLSRIKVMEKAIERLSDSLNDPTAKSDLEKQLLQKEELEKEVDQHANVLSELTNEYEALDQELKEITSLETQQGQIPPDEHTIKLQICQSLGIDMLQNDSGKYTKARIRNSFSSHCLGSTKNNDITEVDLNTDQYSPFYYANLIWESCA